MSNHAGVRERRKEETRRAISDVATRLFVERGFEAVSVAEIAEAAKVARKTVFNYFARKEDLVFDREDELRSLVRQAVAARAGASPVGAFQTLMVELVETKHPLFRIDDRPARFWRMVSESPALTARARALQVILADDLAVMLAGAAGRPGYDAEARLAATLLMGALVVAYGEALRLHGAGGDARAALTQVMARGFAGVDAALAGTPYV